MIYYTVKGRPKPTPGCSAKEEEKKKNYTVNAA
jgi:hypothetical protein